MFVRKLTDDEVNTVRAAHDEYLRLRKEASLLSVESLAIKFEMSQSSIRDLIYYKTYKEVRPTQ